MPIRCLICQSTKIKEVVDDGRLYFYCEQCQKLHERAFDSRHGRDILVTTVLGKQHVSSGGLIKHGDTFLVLKRRTFPFGYDFPGGHVEYNEDPIDTLKREVLEETGLRITRYKLIFQGEIRNNKCRYGIDVHFQHFYECHCSDTVVFLNPESEGIEWHTVQSLDELELVAGARYLFDNVIKKHYGETHVSEKTG